MAIAHDAWSESHTSGSTGSVSQASFSWTHTPAGTPAAAYVAVFTMADADYITSVTYGGVAMTQEAGAEASDPDTEAARVTVFSLESGVPTGAQTVEVTRTNNATGMSAECVTVTSGDAAEFTGVVLLNDDGTIAQQNVDDGSPGTNSVRYAAGYYGRSGLAAGAASTFLGGMNMLAGSASVGMVRETTAGQGSRAVGFANGTSDDRAVVHWAVREVAGAATFALAGVAAGTAAMTGAINHTYGLVGAATASATMVGNLAHAYALSGSAAAVAAMTGDLGKWFLLAGSADAVASMTGAVQHTYGLSGTAAATGSMTGALAHAYALAGLAEGTATMVGDVTIGTAGFALAGSADGVASMTGQVTIAYPLAGSAAAIATLAGALSHAYALAGQADGVATVTGNLSHAYGLGGTAAGTAAMTGGISHTYGLSGLAAAVATMVGDLQSGVIVLGDAVIVFTQLEDGSIDFVIHTLASLTFTDTHEATLTAMATEYDRGDTTRPTVTFTVDDAVTDPTTVSLQVITPAKVSTTYTYAGGQVTKSGTGVYYRDISLDQSGVWYFRFVGTGSCEAAVEGTVTVRA